MIKHPDYQRWLQKPWWRLDDAVLLVLGIDPESQHHPRRRPKEGGLRMKVSTLPNIFWDFLDTAMKSEGRDLNVIEYSGEGALGATHAKVRPLVFVKWAQKLGYLIPCKLLEYIGETEPEAVSETEDPEQGIEQSLIRISVPKKKDAWFEMMRDGALAYERKHGRTPSQSQLWLWLTSNPPAEFSAKYDERKKVLKTTDGILSRDNFNKRYGNYYPSNKGQ